VLSDGEDIFERRLSANLAVRLFANERPKCPQETSIPLSAAVDHIRSLRSATVVVRFRQKLPMGRFEADSRQGAPIVVIPELGGLTQ
jgi:hypothetical protein